MMYPLFISGQYFRCLVVGGGNVALHKVKGLLRKDIKPCIVSPSVAPELEQLIVRNGLDWRERNYQSADLAGMNMVFAATSDAGINAMVCADAEEPGILYNDVGSAGNSNFFVPALVKRGDLELAVSTTGKAPFLSHRLKEYFDGLLPEDAGNLVEKIVVMRASIIERAGDNATLKDELIEKDLEPLIQQFINILGK